MKAAIAYSGGFLLLAAMVWAWLDSRGYLPGRADEPATTGPWSNLDLLFLPVQIIHDGVTNSGMGRTPLILVLAGGTLIALSNVGGPPNLERRLDPTKIFVLKSYLSADDCTIDAPGLIQNSRVTFTRSQLVCAKAQVNTGPGGNHLVTWTWFGPGGASLRTNTLHVDFASPTQWLTSPPISTSDLFYGDYSVWMEIAGGDNTEQLFYIR